MTFEDFKTASRVIEGKVGKPFRFVPRYSSPECCTVSVVVDTPHGRYPGLAVYGMDFFDRHDTSEAISDLGRTAIRQAFEKYYGDG